MTEIKENGEIFSDEYIETDADYEAYQREQKEFEEKCKVQRAERGYSDSDVWNFYDWFLEVIPKMIQDLRNNHVGHPSVIYDETNDSFFCEDTGKKLDDQKWNDILDQIIIFAKEAAEETCSMENPYRNEWWKYHEEFDRKYPNKDVLKTPKELADEKRTHTYYHVGPSRDPDFGKKYDEVSKKVLDFDDEIFKYRNYCKDQLFELMRIFFWDLWD